jgi:hypothetical protein
LSVANIECSEFFSDAAARLLSQSIPHALGVSILMGLIKRPLDRMAARERAELYFAEHPGTSSAMRRPQLSQRCGTWVALLGPDLKNGIAGFGLTVEAALRAFDGQYLAHLRPTRRIRSKSPKFGEIPPSQFGH